MWLFLCCAAGFLLASCSAQAQNTLSLRQAIQVGLARAPEAHTSGDYVELQRAQITGAKLRPNPRLWISADDLNPWDKSFDFPNTTEDYAYLSQNFELDGRRGKRVDYTQKGLRRTEAEQRLTLRRIAAAIANAYWSAAAMRAQAADWKQQLADFNRLVQYQSDRVKAGATAGVDLLRVQIERDRVALSYAQAERNADAASIELARATALPAAESATLTDALEQQRTVPALPIAAAIEQRPDVQAALAAVTEAHSNVTLQHANGVPDLDFFAGYKRNVGADTIYTGVNIDLPFFNRNQGGVATAHAQVQLAEDHLAYIRLMARAQIATAVSGYTREQELVHGTLPGMDERAARNAAIIADAYRSGGADLLRLLDAERTLIDTRLLATQTWAAYQQAVVTLHLAYGEQP